MSKEGKTGSSKSQGLCSHCEGKATESFKQGCNVTRIEVVIRKQEVQASQGEGWAGALAEEECQRWLN